MTSFYFAVDRMAAAFRTFHQGGEDGRTWDRKGTLSAGLTVIFSGLGAAAGVWQTSAVSLLQTLQL